MSIPLWVADLASAFWIEAGDREAFPRNLRQPIANAVPLAVVLLPKLSIVVVTRWLRKSGISCELGERERALKGCLVARSGWGVAFVDGSDAEDEQRFSLAHELAHFLRHYWRLRQQIARHIGMPALDVLDGKRSATKEERLDALLGNVEMNMQVHLLERDTQGNPLNQRALDAELDADRLAYELLAPAEDVLKSNGDPAQNLAALEKTLQSTYGLPSLQAREYAAMLAPAPRRNPLLLKLRRASNCS